MGGRGYLTPRTARCNIPYSMSKRTERPKTMTELLRQAIAEADSFLGIEKATGVKRQSIMRFVRGEQSLRLDMADRLAAYFGIRCRRVRRQKGDA